MSTLFEWQGADTLAAEELAMLPGMDELFGLLMVRRHWREALYAALIVGAAPPGETLKLLSLPDQIGWGVRKGFSVPRRGASVGGALRPRAESCAAPPQGSAFGARPRVSQ